jgi:hypothetical protein
MFNCLVVGNTAKRDGAGVSANWDVQLSISNCTFAENEVTSGNFAAGYGGGLSTAYEANAKIIDSIFWNDYAENGREISIGSSFDAASKKKAEVTVTYSNIQGGGAGVFNDQESDCNLIGFDEHTTNLFGTNLSDPNFMSLIGFGDYFLGANDVNDPPLQPMDHNNPNIDAGSSTAQDKHMYKHTTRTDLELDDPNSKVDLGYHYTRTAAILGDFNFDGKVNLTDFKAFMNYWMSSGCKFPYFCDGRDFTGDGEVDFEDFALFAENYQLTEKNPPTPNPMKWDIQPSSITSTSIKMVAKLAIDNSGSKVSYWFECTTHPIYTSKVWDTNTTYIVSGLTTGEQYGFRVRAKDENGNMTGWSPEVLVTAGEDTTSPNPDPMTWAVPPTLKSTNGHISITMTASTATDVAGVEYSFEEMLGHSGATDSGWIPITTYEDFNLEPNTVYAYRVKARDKSYKQNETGYSTVVSVRTPSTGQDANDVNDVNDPNGANDITAPAPVEWSILPYVRDLGSYYVHYMAAAAATDASGEVWYYFEAVEGSEKTNSGWISVPYWQAGGFWGVNHCSYHFKVKDKYDNESGWSPVVSTYYQ